jgi:hypothetical protein
MTTGSSLADYGDRAPERSAASLEGAADCWPLATYLGSQIDPWWTASLRQDPLQAIEIDRLNEVFVEARFECAPTVRLLPVSGNSYQPN